MNGLRPHDNPRARCTNPRAKGTNPRATGTNPRAPLTAAARFDELERQAKRLRTLERRDAYFTGRSDAVRRRLEALRAAWEPPGL